MPGRPASRGVSFDRIARPYRWLEYFSFGRALERCRFALLAKLAGANRALLYGDGDGRFLARFVKEIAPASADYVDSSAAMLQLARTRAMRTLLTSERRRTRPAPRPELGSELSSELRFHHADALAFAPDGSYDLVVTHFFLDCFRADEIDGLLSRLAPHLAVGARWLISEFAIPSRPWFALPARIVIAALYRVFGILTGLQTRTLPDYAVCLRRAGFALETERSFLRGLLRSELWRRQDGARQNGAGQS